MTQLDTLKKIINKRPLAICYHGRSATVLRDRIKELEGADICWCGINDFWIMEDDILSQIGEHFDIIICSAKENGVPDKPHIEYLNRREDNLMMLDQDSIHPGQVEKLDGCTFSYGGGQTPQLLKSYKQMTVQDFKEINQDKLFFFIADRSPTALSKPNKDYPLNFLAQASFTILISLGIIGEAKSIFLFGCEGVNEQDDLTYPQYPRRALGQSNRQSLIYDTELFKQTYPTIMRNVALTYDAVIPPIINCGEKSYYGVFPVKGYDECLTLMRL